MAALLSNASDESPSTIRDLVLRSVRNDGNAIQYAPKELKSDRQIIFAALDSSNGAAFEHLDGDAQEDPEIIKRAVAKCGCILAELSEEYREDEDIVLLAVKNDGLALEYASEDLRDSEEICLAACMQNGLSLEFASEILQNNRTVVLAAVAQDGMSLVHCGEDRRDEKDVTLVAVRCKGQALQYTSIENMQDRDIMLAAVHQDGEALQFVVEQLKTAIHEAEDAEDEVEVECRRSLFAEVVFAALANSGGALQYIDLDEDEGKQIRWLELSS